MDSLDLFIDRVNTLPPAPRVLPKLLSLLSKDDVDGEEVVRIIRFDPGLTARVLQVCNSAQWGSARDVGDLQEALLRVGFREVYRIVSSVVARGLLQNPLAGYGMAKGELWGHSAVAAVAAQLIARASGADDQLAFTSGLLHDVGKFLLNASLQTNSTAIVAEIEEQRHSFLEAEKGLAGFDHAEAGGRLLERWKFPVDLVAAVRFHHDPLRAGDSSRLAACVHLGDLVAHFAGGGVGFEAFAVRGRPEARDLLGITAQDIDQFVLNTRMALDELPFLTQSSNPNPNSNP